MAMNKYRERILNMGKQTDARIALPEIRDKRVQEAIDELTSLGYKIAHNQDFQDNIDIYLDYLDKLSFTTILTIRTTSNIFKIPSSLPSAAQNA